MPGVNVDPNIHLVKLGLNYHFGDTPPGPRQIRGKDRASRNRPTGTCTRKPPFCPSAYPAFRSPYAGPNSLPGGGQARETWTTTAFLGVRLWQGGEFYFDPELAQGFGLNGTLGTRGLSQRRGAEGGRGIPENPAATLLFKQTFGLGGEQEDVADGRQQLPGKRDIDRVTLIVGRFAVGDFFDGNAYAEDPRADFMNWAMWSSAAYDFPADLPGYTRGGIVELNRKDWAVRAGCSRCPTAPNSDVLTCQERRHRRRIRGTLTRSSISPANCGSACSPTAAIPAITGRRWRSRHADPALDINAVMTSIRTRQPQIRLLRQPRAADRQGHRPVRPRELERRPERNPVVHRYRPQPVGRRFDQGQLLGTAGRHGRHRRRHQRPVRRPTAISSRPAASAF